METIDDIVKWLRNGCGEFALEIALQKLNNPHYDADACMASALRVLADRIDKAAKHEMSDEFSAEIQKLTDELYEARVNTSRIIAERNELAELNRKCCDENEQLKAAHAELLKKIQQLDGAHENDVDQVVHLLRDSIEQNKKIEDLREAYVEQRNKIHLLEQAADSLDHTSVSYEYSVRLTRPDGQSRISNSHSETLVKARYGGLFAHSDEEVSIVRREVGEWEEVSQ